MIIECPECGAKNQTTQPPQPGKTYHCGKCGAIITFLQPVDEQGGTEPVPRKNSVYEHSSDINRARNKQSWTRIFHSDGRCPRIEYALILITGNIINGVLYYFSYVTLLYDSWWLILILIPALAVSGTMIIAGIRRLHDLNYSGWYFLFILVPFANLALILYLLFAPGKKEGNQWE